MSVEGVLGRPDFRISCSKLLRAQGAIVYAWVRDGKALYVGMSNNGLIRPLSASHDVCWAFQDGDQLLVWKARDRDDARRLERLAITLVGPAFNGSTSERPQRPEQTDGEDEEDDPLFADDEEPASHKSGARNLTLFGDPAA